MLLACWITTTSAVVLAASLAQDVERVLPYPSTALPAVTEDPRTPGPARSGEVVAPKSQALARNAFVVDRFLAEGQVVSYTVELAAEELALFELATYGYERGWQSSATMIVRDAAGEERARLEAEGGTVYRMLLPFQATGAGDYTLELCATRQYFRYSLVRHSNFVPHQGELTFLLGSTGPLYDYLAPGLDPVNYYVDVAAGERLELLVTPLSAALSRQLCNARRAALLAAATAPVMAAEDSSGSARGRMQGSGMMRAAATTSGDCAPLLRWDSASTDALETAPYLCFEALQAQRLKLQVLPTTQHAGGLYRLEIWRNRERAHVQGVISDSEGDPHAAVRLDFHREPELELVAQAVTAADGSYQVAVPLGEYTVLLRAGESRAPVVLQARVAGALEMNGIAPRQP